MTESLIITILGGGSVWTPRLLLQLADLALAENAEIRLYGPSLEHLHDVASFTNHVVRRAPFIKITTDLEVALCDASIILNQSRIGGLAARSKDESISKRFGVVSDESLGLGGFLAGIRTWPFISRAAPIIIKNASDAWLLNLTNPSDLVSRAWCHCGCNFVIGLCDFPQLFARKIATAAECPGEAERFNFIGTSHVGWLLPPANIDLDRLFAAYPHIESWYRKWSAIPTPWRIHLDNPGKLIEIQRNNPIGRAQELRILVDRMRSAIRKKDKRLYSDLLKNRTPSWYSEVVIPAINALAGGESSRLIVGIPTDKLLNDIKYKMPLETWTRINDRGVYPEPLPQNPLCREDILKFLEIRDLAFTAMINNTRKDVDRYIRNDPYTCSLISRQDYIELSSDCL